MQKNPKLIRITTVPLSLNVLLRGQMRYMNENGFDVLMVSADGKELDIVKQNEQCRHQIVPMTRKITPLADLRSLWLLYKLFKNEKPDIVHSHTPKAGLLAMLAAKAAGSKIRVHTIAGLRFMTAKGTTRKILVAMEKLTASAATHVWPNSFSLLEYIKTNQLVKPSKLEVIGLGSSNGINLSRYSTESLQPEKLQQIKNLVQYDEQLIYFVSVGRIVQDKGIDELVKAFSAVYETNKQIRLILVGAFEDDLDPISDEARQIINTHPGILQPGWSETVEYFMHFAFALVHPSHREGFPNVLLQAGAMHCPIICSRIEGNVDIVDHEKTGLIFEARNQNDLQAMLEKALANPQALQQYAATLRAKIEQHFAQPIVHQYLHQRYLSILAANSTSSHQ
jgi:glycosyltransferase involved in cell wall biosynthesis